jgi:hypothetical protein
MAYGRSVTVWSWQSNLFCIKLLQFKMGKEWNSFSVSHHPPTHKRVVSVSGCVTSWNLQLWKCCQQILTRLLHTKVQTFPVEVNYDMWSAAFSRLIVQVVYVFSSQYKTLLPKVIEPWAFWLLATHEVRVFEAFEPFVSHFSKTKIWDIVDIPTLRKTRGYTVNFKFVHWQISNHTDKLCDTTLCGDFKTK